MINLKPSFEEEKKKIKKSFSTENSGLKNCRRNSDLVDKVINQIFSYQIHQFVNFLIKFIQLKLLSTQSICFTPLDANS